MGEFVDVAQALDAGVDIITLALLCFIWKLDRRLLRIEVKIAGALGVDTKEKG